jgi:copper resistance protein C
MPSTLRDRPARAWSVLAVAVLAGGAVLLGAPPASAHDSLTGASPADGETLTSAPERVVLSFSAEVKDLGLTVLVTSPDGRRVGDGPARVEGTDVIAPLVALTEPGRYTVAYRVVSSDGHPIQGRTAFVLDLAAPSAPPATPTAAPGTATPDASPVAATGQDGGSPWLWVLGGVAVLALTGGAVALARSRST